MSDTPGKWAGSVEERLTRMNFFCRTMFYRDWRRVMLEKCAFLTVFPLVGALHPKEDGSASSLADVADFFEVEADDMLYELGRTLRGHLAVTLLGGYPGRMFALASSEHKDTPAVVKDWRWRNGPWYELSHQHTTTTHHNNGSH